MDLLLVLGNQLFARESWPEELRKSSSLTVFMREDYELCRYYTFHKHKIMFFLGAMRAYRDDLRSKRINVIYEELGQKSQSNFEDSFLESLKSESIRRVFLWEIEDKFFERRILNSLRKSGIDFLVLTSPMFLTRRDEFQEYLLQNRKPFMKTFYEKQRRRLQVLVDKHEKPLGGKWSFDEDNRKALPVAVRPPEFVKSREFSKEIAKIAKLTNQKFSDHPGQVDDFWLPVDRVGARKWLKEFIHKRLASFGPYEDAMPAHSDFVFHSVLTPFLNTGLLTPQEILEELPPLSHSKHVPLESLEGFVRQIIGWREFVRGIYQNFSEIQERENFWGHKNRLSPVWYTGNSGIPLLDRVLAKVFRYGYCHHIERLMVLGNLMLLLEVKPSEAHKWFMEMFVDSSDWVMGPNVFGMALMSDGGIFATKPYICGSNYWRKMSGEKKGPWCDGVDGLYWNFVLKNRKFFLKNPRLSMMTRMAEKIPKNRLAEITRAADRLRSTLIETD